MQFRVLGAVGASEGGHELAVNGVRRKALLACLALSCGQVLSAERLIADVWNGDPPPGVGSTLKAHVSHLRRVLRAPGLLVSSPPGYVLRADPDSVDALRFEQLAGEGRVALFRGDAAGAADHFDEALSLFTGPPLADLADLDFAAREADRLELVRLDVIEQRSEAALALGRHASVAEQLDALVAEHPLRERLTGLLMRALYRGGRQADALRVYRRTADRLVEELGLDPSEELREIEQQILLQAPELAAVPPARVSPPAPAEPPGRPPAVTERPPLPASLRARRRRGGFVGRARELELLTRSWREVQEGHGALCLVRGDAGVGKSRLVAELAAAVHTEGASVLHGHCDPERTIPFQPFAETLEGLGEEAMAALVARRPDGADTGETDAGEERHHLFGRVTAVLADHAAERPVLVVVDDLHEADAGSLLLLRHLLRSFPAHPMLVLATALTGGLPPGVEGLTDTLGRDGLLHELVLGELDDQAATALVEAELAAPGPPDPATVAAVVTLAHGNPLLLCQLSHHAHLMTDGDGGAPADPAAPRPASPTEVHRLVGLRLQHLDAETRDGLAVAATVGPTFDTAVLFELLGRAASVVIDRALLARVIEPIAPTVATYRFTHRLLREVAALQMDSYTRRDVHRRTAEVLARRAAADPRRWAAEWARHLVAALPDTADGPVVPAAVAAGDAAMDALAFEEACTWYEDAAELLVTWGGPSDAAACDVWLAMGRARLAAGRWQGASDAFARAAGEARRLGDASRLAEAALGYRGDYHSTDVADSRLEQLTLEALDVVPGASVVLRSTLLAQLSLSRFHGGGSDARALADEALTLAREGDEPRSLVLSLHARHTAEWFDRLPEERIPLAEEMVARATRAGYTAGAQMGRWNLALDQLERGELAGADEQLGRLRRQGDVTGRVVDLWWADLISAAVLTAQDRIEEASALAGSAADVGTRLCPDDAGLFFAVQLFMLHWARGRLGEIQPAVERLARGDTPTPGLQAVLAVLHAETGDHDRAARIALDATQPEALASLRRDRTRAAILALLAHVVATCSLREPAAALVRELAPLAGRQVVLGPGLALLGPASLWLARLGDVLAGSGGTDHDWWKQADDEAVRWGVWRWTAHRVAGDLPRAW